MRATVLMLFLATLMSGCSDENSQVRGQFLSGCIQGGAPKAICTCTFEKLEAIYTPEELRALNKPFATPPESFLKAVMASAQACQAEQ